MRIFLSIKYFEDCSNRPLVEAVSTALGRAGCCTFCVARDLEAWGEKHFNPTDLMIHTFRAIETCDLLVVEASHKGVGLGIEAGYAYARGIPVLVIAPKEVEISATLGGIASQVIYYRQPEELQAPFMRLRACLEAGL